MNDRDGIEMEPMETGAINEHREHAMSSETDNFGNGNNSLESEFACSVCLQLSVLPTTLTCGHTCCRHCLAQWYFSSKKKECPLCKAVYLGHPKINTQLRNMLARLYPDEMEQREKEARKTSNQTLIATYDQQMNNQPTQQSSGSQNAITSFCSGIIIATCIFVVIYLAWYWKSHDDGLLVKKPVILWSPTDVEVWLQEIPWAVPYASVAKHRHIDGRFLLSIEETYLTEIFNVTETWHSTAFMLLIKNLRDNGVKMPKDLWEYKAIYPGRCLFLVFGLKDFPRTTILYLWLYFREEMYYPFVIATQEKEIVSYIDSLSTLESTANIQPSKTASWGFLYYAVLMPEYLIGVFTYRMFRHHLITPIFVLVADLCRVVLESQKILDMIRVGSWRHFRRQVVQMGKQHMKHLISAFMFMVLWPIIPNFVCDVFFYLSLYISPLLMLSNVYSTLQERRPVP